MIEPKDYTEIITWLYTNDGKYPSAAKWREEFINLLKSLTKKDKQIKSAK